VVVYTTGYSEINTIMSRRISRVYIRPRKHYYYYYHHHHHHHHYSIIINCNWVVTRWQ